MRVISHKRLVDAAKNRPGAADAIDRWYRIAKRADWRSIHDVRRVFPTADPVGEFTVFNLSGNQYRLITVIRYTQHNIFIDSVLTHREYDEWSRRQRAKK